MIAAASGPGPHWAQSFSGPASWARRGIFAAAAISQARVLTGWLLESHGGEVARQSDGLVGYLADWCASETTFDVTWDVAFGNIQQARCSTTFDVHNVAVSLGLHLSAAGHGGSWRARFSEPATLYVGQTRLSGQLVEVHDGQVTLDGVPTLTCPSQGYCAGTGPGSSRERRLLVWGDEAQYYARRFEGDVRSLETQVEAYRATLANALDILDKSAPAYRQWVQEVLRTIVPCASEGACRVISGSGETLPGVIHCSFPVGAPGLAEVLIHESAHQFFYLLDRCGALDDGRDSRLYWSPPIRRSRPLDRILMAYHALANVKLFYVECRVRGARMEVLEYIDSCESQLNRDLCTLDEPLRDNCHLTVMGRSLYEPLAHALRNAGLGDGE